MKQIAQLFLVLVLVVLSSCKKDDPTVVPISLIGTLWVYEDMDSRKHTFFFPSATDVTYKQDWVESGEEKTETSLGIYSYVAPNVSILVNEINYVGVLKDTNTMDLGGLLYIRK